MVMLVVFVFIVVVLWHGDGGNGYADSADSDGVVVMVVWCNDGVNAVGLTKHSLVKFKDSSTPGKTCLAL